MTVTKKIVISLSTIALIGTISMLIVLYGLNVLGNAMHKVASIKQPSSEAAYEMEINTLGIAMGVLKYLNDPDSEALKQIQKDEKDFELFHFQFLKLAETEREKEIGKRMALVYDEFKNLAKTLIEKRNDQTAILGNVASNFERMDEIIDTEIQSNISSESPDGSAKMEISMDLEADLAEVGMQLATYRQNRTNDQKDLIVKQENEFRAGMAKFKKLKLNDQENRSMVALEKVFNLTMSLVGETLFLDAYFQQQSEKFVALRSQMDRILDEEIQVLTMKELYEPKREADRAAASVFNMMRILIPLFVLSAVLVGFVLIGLMTRPINKLIGGTDAVGRGDLSHRIVLRGQDEFVDLANQFNHMVQKLEATTVSKVLLEKSEVELRDTVSELRLQIADRKRAELERVQLQIALRRSEIMAAMGSMVAGFAHEARNPLFGISSIIDALEARLTTSGTVGNYGEHIRLLRQELDRLTKLMQDLLDYGKPTNLEFAAGSLREVILEAMDLCSPVADQFETKVRSDVRAGNAMIKMHREHLVHAFRNLIDNAVRHSPPGTDTVIEVEEFRQNGERWIECYIKDSGPGFPVQDLSRVFEPFFSRRRGGTGLGLSIVQRIVEAHNGSVFAGNRSEGGGVVTVRLPLFLEGLQEIEGTDGKKDFGG